jgi:hypothetical protein
MARIEQAMRGGSQRRAERPRLAPVVGSVGAEWAGKQVAGKDRSGARRPLQPPSPALDSAPHPRPSEQDSPSRSVSNALEDWGFTGR